MRRISSWAVLIMMVLGVGGVAAPAEAGGSTFDFSRRWFAPGEWAVGRAQFSDWVGAQGRVAQGPYFAYLIRGDRWIEPPRLPRNAIRLGQMRMLRVEGTIWEASIRFVVPDVRPGNYMVSLCNDPCRSASVGDLVGAWIFVAASTNQAKMRNLEAQIEERVTNNVSETISSTQEQLDSLREAVAAEQSRTMSVGTQLRLDAIDERLQGMNVVEVPPPASARGPGRGGTAHRRTHLRGCSLDFGRAFARVLPSPPAAHEPPAKGAGSRRRPPRAEGERAALVHVERSEHAHPWRETSRSEWGRRRPQPLVAAIKLGAGRWFEPAEPEAFSDSIHLDRVAVANLP